MEQETLEAIAADYIAAQRMLDNAGVPERGAKLSIRVAALLVAQNDFTLALAATVNARLLARPVAGLREGCGYYVAEGRVWWYDRTGMTADRKPLVKLADWLPPWAVLAGEWEAVER